MKRILLKIYRSIEWMKVFNSNEPDRKYVHSLRSEIMLRMPDYGLYVFELALQYKTVRKIICFWQQNYDGYWALKSYTVFKSAMKIVFIHASMNITFTMLKNNHKETGWLSSRVQWSIKVTGKLLYVPIALWFVLTSSCFNDQNHLFNSTKYIICSKE